MIWAAPTGKTYITHPASRLFLPDWYVATADCRPPPQRQPPSPTAV
ncbi:MAG TPA: hypothetical protein VEF72_09445 [Mycobacterium sp.]|nr:hypothetical protein [Mycobacterium sp.]